MAFDDDVSERRRSVPRASLPVFYDDEIPSMATHCHQAECGYSLYRGVLVRWDEDHDARVLDLVDEIKGIAGGWVGTELLVVQEHEGSVAFVWSGFIPADYREDRDVDVCGDVWAIASSVSVTDAP